MTTTTKTVTPLREVTRSVPRLEGVREAIRLQGKHYDGRGAPGGPPRGDDIPLGARLLRLALDLDALEARGIRLDQTPQILRAREGL